MHLLGLAFENVNGVWEFCALLITVRPSHAPASTVFFSSLFLCVISSFYILFVYSDAVLYTWHPVSSDLVFLVIFAFSLLLGPRIVSIVDTGL